MRCRRPGRRDSRRARDPGRCRLAVKAGSTGIIARGAAPITAHHCAIHVRAETERRNRHVPLRPLGIEIDQIPITPRLLLHSIQRQ